MAGTMSPSEDGAHRAVHLLPKGMAKPLRYPLSPSEAGAPWEKPTRAGVSDDEGFGTPPPPSPRTLHSLVYGQPLAPSDVAARPPAGQPPSPLGPQVACLAHPSGDEGNRTPTPPPPRTPHHLRECGQPLAALDMAARLQGGQPPCPPGRQAARPGDPNGDELSATPPPPGGQPPSLLGPHAAAPPPQGEQLPRPLAARVPCQGGMPLGAEASCSLLAAAAAGPICSTVSVDRLAWSLAGSGAWQ